MYVIIFSDKLRFYNSESKEKLQIPERKFFFWIFVHLKRDSQQVLNRGSMGPQGIQGSA